MAGSVLPRIETLVGLNPWLETSERGLLWRILPGFPQATPDRPPCVVLLPSEQLLAGFFRSSDRYADSFLLDRQPT